jgi:hypothetical protein
MAYTPCAEIGSFHRSTANGQDFYCQGDEAGCACVGGADFRARAASYGNAVVYRTPCPADGSPCLAQAPCLKMPGDDAEYCVYFQRPAFEVGPSAQALAWGPQRVVPSAWAADVFGTLKLDDGPADKVCWMSLETYASEYAGFLEEAYPPFGFLLVQGAMYKFWTDGYGTMCPQHVKIVQDLNKLTNHLDVYEDEVGACQRNLLMEGFEALGFAESPRVPLPNKAAYEGDPMPQNVLDACNALRRTDPPYGFDGPPQPPPAPEGGVCTLAPSEPCSGARDAGSTESYPDAAGFFTTTCACRPCGGREEGERCSDAAVQPGTCRSDTAPERFCWQLDQPLCSDLRGLVEPGACGETSGRACAPRLGSAEPWTCQLAEDASCPATTLPCYWGAPAAGPAA